MTKPSNAQVIGSYKRTAQNRGGYVEVASVYNTYGISYNHVCGRVIGYQYYSPDAFAQFIRPQTIEGPYVDGVSLTHGPPGARQHVWTFAAGIYETSFWVSCPCAGGAVAPSFVGNDYFCESGNPGTTWTNTLYASDTVVSPTCFSSK